MPRRSTHGARAAPYREGMPPVIARLRPLLEPAVGLVFLLLWIQAEIGRAHPTGSWIVLAVYAAAIALSRLAPLASLAAVAAVPVLQLLGVMAPPESTTWPIAFAGIAAAYATGRSPRAVVRWIGLAGGVLVSAVLGVVLVKVGDWRSWTGLAGSGNGSDLGPSGNPSGVQFAVLLGAVALLGWALAWSIGLGLQLAERRRHDRQRLLETERELVTIDAERRSALERTAIAHEVHDVLAHSLTVVIAVADGARYLREAKPGTAPVRTDDALREIAGAARSALVDLRGLLEGLRDDPGGDPLQPRPALADLGALVDRVAATGMRVHLEQLGEPRPLTPTQELSVYRIVQESLTNALKHGGAHPVAAVSLSWDGDGDGLALTVVSLGVPAPAEDGAAAVQRFGIRSMRERAELAGGWLTAGPESDGEYVVTAFIPLAADREPISAGAAGAIA
ncbi:hypothetical protein GCM10017602_32570 [Herbiconiux flava]|nr:hypothetical protein GCM10017602_32570 [Herbiconiux flava]